MKNILIVIGGGRPNGNTEQLVNAFIRGAEDAGHHTEKISLLKTEVKGRPLQVLCKLKKPI